MNGNALIVVTGGIHAGASVLLSDGHDLSIGSGESVDLVLIDEGVAAHHATIRLDGGKLTLVAKHEGVAVFGHALRAGKSTGLRYGGSFTLGAATLQFSGCDALTPRAARKAELAWLLAHAPMAYAMKRSATLPLPAKAGFTVLGLVLVGAVAWQAASPFLATKVAREPENPAFRFVRTRIDAKTGVPVYEGYVQSYADLSALAIAARKGARTPVLRVIVIDQLRDQLQAFVDKYYRASQLQATQPGTFAVTTPPADGYLQPESWDYARVARLARAEINGLNELTFVGHAVSGGAVRVPLESIGMNLMRSSHGSWLVDQQGGMYFAGSRLKIGKLTRISECAAEVVRDDDGSVYEFFTRDTQADRRC
jgi:Inner membrane component of T3SS, cytoplasmic domain